MQSDEIAWEEINHVHCSYKAKCVGIVEMGSMGAENGSTVMAKAPTSNMDSVRVAASNLVTMAAIPGAVAALVRLNVFNALARAGDGAVLTAGEIAALALPGKATNLTYLSRLLRMVAAKKILREVVVDEGARRYGLAPIGRFLVDDSDRGSFAPLLLTLQGGVCLRTWAHVHESVMDDSVAPFSRAHGVSAWEYGRQHFEYGELFNQAMAGHSEVYMRAILDAYRGFHDVQVVVDVGGGFGNALRLITARYPHIRGINFDQDHVIDVCPPLPGVEHVSGNMFESVPSGGDAIFMKYILHDWDDARCLKILKNCYQALPAHGKVITVDYLLPEIIDFEGGDHIAFQIDIHMLAVNDSGACERTEREYRELGLAAGFKQVKVMCKVDNEYAVTEFHKSARYICEQDGH